MVKHEFVDNKMTLQVYLSLFLWIFEIMNPENILTITQLACSYNELFAMEAY
jgi:hypothetical protein